MQLFAHIDSGTVREIFRVPDGLTFGEDLYPAALVGESVPCDATIVTGQTFDKATGKFGPVPAPAKPVPENVWDWQFAGQAAELGFISSTDARAWCGTGTIPANLLAAVDKAITDPAQHERVVLFLMGASQFPRHHAVTETLAPILGLKTAADLDAFFVQAGAR